MRNPDGSVINSCIVLTEAKKNVFDKEFIAQDPVEQVRTINEFLHPSQPVFSYGDFWANVSSVFNLSGSYL